LNNILYKAKMKAFNRFFGSVLPTSARGFNDPVVEGVYFPETSRKRTLSLFSNQKTAKSITKLPNDILFYIFCFLTQNELCNVAAVCGRLRLIVELSRLFRQLTNKRLLREDPLLQTPVDDWRLQYLNLIQIYEKRIHDVEESLKKFNNGNQKSALSVLAEEDIVPAVPMRIAHFLMSNSKGINKKALGDFLNARENLEILERYIQLFEISDLDIIDSLRAILERMELPETQKLGPLFEKFAKRFLEKHPKNTINNPAALSNLCFTLYTTCFSESSHRRQQFIPLKRFLENCRGINDGRDLSVSFLENLYEKLIHTGLGYYNVNFRKILKCGWLTKQGNDFMQLWKKRWFLLSESVLLYYKKIGDHQPLGKIPLYSILIERISGRKHTFRITILNDQADRSSHNNNPSETGSKRDHFYLSAENEEDYDDWISNIEECRKVLSKRLAAGSSQRKSKKKKSNATESELSVNKPVRYFGVSLKEILNREKRSIPLLVERAVQYLTDTALDEEGILRMCGSSTEVDTLKEEIEAGKIEFTRRDPHAVATLLKRFFRDLPEPLISQEINSGASAVLGFGFSEDAVLEEIKTILHSLPPENLRLFQYLISFLIKVSEHSGKNKMNMENLIRVVGPNLYCLTRFISLSMEHYGFFFEDEELWKRGEISASISPESSLLSTIGSMNEDFGGNNSSPNSNSPIRGDNLSVEDYTANSNVAWRLPSGSMIGAGLSDSGRSNLNAIPRVGHRSCSELGLGKLATTQTNALTEKDESLANDSSSDSNLIGHPFDQTQNEKDHEVMENAKNSEAIENDEKQIEGEGRKEERIRQATEESNSTFVSMPSITDENMEAACHQDCLTGDSTNRNVSNGSSISVMETLLVKESEVNLPMVDDDREGMTKSSSSPNNLSQSVTYATMEEENHVNSSIGSGDDNGGANIISGIDSLSVTNSSEESPATSERRRRAKSVKSGKEKKSKKKANSSTIYESESSSVKEEKKKHRKTQEANISFSGNGDVEEDGSL